MADQRHLMDAMVDRVKLASAFRVTPDMCAMIDHASRQLPDDEKMDHTLAPDHTGFVRFDDPLPLMDPHGRLQKVSWILWGGVMKASDQKPGLLIWAFNDTVTHPDDVHEALIDEINKNLQERSRPTLTLQDTLSVLGRWGWVGAQLMEDEVTVGTTMSKVDVEDTGDFPDMSVVFGKEYTNFKRYMHAFFLMINQTITQVEDAKIDRSTRRRVVKMGIPDRVSVIQLRRLEHRPNEGETLVEWSHRWAVRGHWRMQRKGPNLSEVERIWIAPFIKGPEDKPLVITDKVYDLRR